MLSVTAVTYRLHMSLRSTPPRLLDAPQWQRTLDDLRAVGQMDVAFAAQVTQDGTMLEITGTSGAATRVLDGVRVDAGHGLGGKALVLGRPASVQRYVAAKGITHQYDRLVQAERIETMTVLPIFVDRVPKMMMYLAHRRPLNLGDVWFDACLPLVRKAERDLRAEEQVRRRLDQLQHESDAVSGGEASARSTLRSIVDELADIASSITDEQLRSRLDALQQLASGHARHVAETTLPAPPPRLGGREVDVLREVALGRTNRQVADALGIVESTAKWYLKSAMRKLEATNRVHAVRIAREAGFID